MVDASGLNCPLPLLKAKKALALVQVGERVYLMATDPNTLRDLGDYARQVGHRVVHRSEVGGVFHIVIERC
jgi:tRNA 2-thiouridine synthesizing protein A